MSTNKKKSVTKKVVKTTKPAKAVTKKAVSKKVAVTKKVAKKVATKKAVVKKVAIKKAVVKKAPAKKAIVKKAAIKVVAKKTVSVKPTTKKTTSKSLVAPISKKKAMKKEDTPKNSSKDAASASKNMPLLKQEPAYLERIKNAPKENRTHYSKEELKEFDDIISEKLELARKQLQFAKDVLNRKNDEGTDNTTGNVKLLEDGADVFEKESFSSFAARQQKFILQLENAHARIKNGTYGVCIVSGKLIPKERLKLVPHTQHTIEAKEQRK